MDTEEKLNTLTQVMLELNDLETEKIACALLAKGVEPVKILTVCERALTVIGEKYAAGEYFIAGLIMAGEIMSRITELITPYLPKTTPNLDKPHGRVLIGTVEGDIHDLGKNIAGAFLSAHGFKVRDLGVDVPPDDFIAECLQFQPDIIGLSALLCSRFPALGETVAILKKHRGEQNKPVIFISGGQLTENHRELYGADFFVHDAYAALKLCEKLMAH